jgi:hypothetical protein
MEIVPFKSVGRLAFGDARSTVREKLITMFTTFAKIEGATETDSFDDLGLHLYYDDAGILEFIETFIPANITFREISFLGRDVHEVIKDMAAIGYDSTDADVGVDFPDAGIALTAPSGIVEGIAAHRKGYYD